MTTPTALPIPSNSPLDLAFNAEKIDEAVNTGALSYIDRFGVPRKTLAGAVASISATNVRGAWATATVYAPRDVVSNAGTWYISLDNHTSGGTFAGDLAAHWRVYQGLTAVEVGSTSPGQGSSMVGSNDAGNYFNGTNVETILQEIASPTGQFQTDGINVLRYIPPAEWAAILAGTSTTNLYTYLQAALTAQPNLVFPSGLYNTGTKLVPRVDAKIRGVSRRGAMLKGTSAITILEFQYGTFDAVVQNMRFTGAGCTGIGVAGTAGAFQGYLIRPDIENCDFDFNLAYGINADLIFATLEKSTFGYYGVGGTPAPGASTFVAIRSHSYPSTSNFTNLNTVRNCIFQHAGSLTQAAVTINGGASWLFDSCDWEQGGVCFSADNVQCLQFRGANWFEGNAATNALFVIDDCDVPVVFDGLNITNNSCAEIFRYTGGQTAGMKITNCMLGKAGSSFVLFDATTLSRTLPADGSITFYDNNVVGGSSSDKLVSATDFRGGPTSDRIVGMFNTAGSGTIIFCNDPGISISRPATGRLVISQISHPLGTSVSKVMVSVSPKGAATEHRFDVGTVNSIEVLMFNSAGAAVDSVFSLRASGA